MSKFMQLVFFLSLSLILSIKAIATEYETTPKASKTKLQIKKKKSIPSDSDIRTDANSDEPSETDTSTDRKKAASRSGQSKTARIHKSWGINLLGGSGIVAVPAAGIEVFRSLGPNFQWGLGLHSGSIDFKSYFANLKELNQNGAKIDKFISTLNLLEVYAKYFMGNSFAVIGSIDYYMLNYDMGLSSLSDSTITLKDLIAIQVLGLKVGLGNYWSWKSGFTLGCEWLALVQPLSATSKSTISTTGSSTGLESVKIASEEAALKLAKGLAIQYFVFTIGYQF